MIANKDGGVLPETSEWPASGHSSEPAIGAEEAIECAIERTTNWLLTRQYDDGYWVAELEGDTIKEARLALGGVAHKPWRDLAVEASLRGQTAKREAFMRAADELLRDAKGRTHNAFKIDLARRAIARALTQAARGTPQSQASKKVR